VRIDNNYSAFNAYGRTGGAGGSNADSKAAAGDFGGILQKQISKATDAEKKDAAVKSEAPSADTFEKSGGADGILNAYGRQLALENGIGAEGRQESFVYQLNQLLDRGLVSRQEIIDAVKVPPKL